MTLLEQVSALRRRWLYLALGFLVGAAAGLATAPGASSAPAQFEATHTLLVEGAGGGQGLNVEQAALLVSEGPVPDRVAERLEDEGLPPFDTLVGTANVEVLSLKIEAISPSAAGAARAADLAAEELIDELSAAQLAAIEEQRAQAQDRVDTLTTALADLEARLLPLLPEDPSRADLEVERGAKLSALETARRDLDALQGSSPPGPPLRSLQAAEGLPVEGEGLQMPDSRPLRGALLGGFGLLLGVAGALAAEQLDTRVRNKDDAERAFDVPVIAEIPPLPAGARGRELLVSTRPAAAFVEAYRSLRTVVLFATEHGPVESAPAGARTADAASNGNGTNGHAVASTPSHPHRARVLLLTSPSAGEGKTTSAAHLAAVLAEFGKSVLVVSADFRRPRIHELFGVEREPGLSDVLESAGGDVKLSDLQMKTNFEGVHLLPSGSPVNNPAQLLSETAQLVAAARSLFDFVIIDTPPLLVANDATELAAAADMVLLFAKADRTSRDAARRSTEILRRIEAPILGVVVVSAHDTPTAYGYYRYRYYAEADQAASGRRAARPGKSAGPKDDIPVAVASERSDQP